MQLEGIKCDAVSLVAFANASWNLTSLKQAHSLLKEAGLESKIKSNNVLVVMYARCNSLAEARRIFDGMLVRDIISWNSIIWAYVQDQDPREALKLFNSMDLEPNSVTLCAVLDACSELGDSKIGREIYEQFAKRDASFQDDPGMRTSLLSMYGRCGELDEAEQVFRSLGTCQDVFSWTALAGAYAQHGHINKSVRLFFEMQLEGVKPSSTLFVTAIDSCLTASQGRKIKAVAADEGLTNHDVGVGNSLVGMYARLGDLNGALQMFQTMEKRDVISWNSLLSCYTQKGHRDSFLSIFRLMQLQGQDPNTVTFVNLLQCCSHSGLVYSARDLFLSMQRDFRIAPTVQHFGCLVDLLGRKGRLQEAEELIFEMPVAPSVAVWTAFLGACTSHDDIDRAERSAERVLELDNEAHAASALAMLSNVRSRTEDSLV